MDFRSDKNRHGLKSHSLILSCFALLSAKVSEAADRSAVCRALTSSGRLDKLLTSGIFAGFFKQVKPYSSVLRPSKKAFCRFTGSSVILAAIKKIIAILLCKPVMTFGAFFFFLGLLSSGVLVLGKLGMLPITPQYGELIFCAAMAVFGFPLMFSRKRLVDTLECSAVFRRVFIDLLGFEEQKLHVDGKSKGDVFLVFLICVILAALSLLVPISTIILYSLSAIAVVFIVVNPEVGALSALILLPMMSNLTVNILMIVTELGYVIKVLLGKRNFRLMTSDVLLLMYMLYRLTLSVLGAGGTEYAFVTVSYFAVRNLLISEDSHRKFIRCASVGATLAAVVAMGIKLCGLLGIQRHIQFILQNDALYNSDDLSVYLIVLLPMIFAGAFCGGRGQRFASFVNTVVVLGCIVWLYDSSLWVVAALPLVIFALLALKAKLMWAVFAAFALPLLYTFGEQMSVSALAGGDIYKLILSQSGAVGLVAFAIVVLLYIQAVFAAKRDAAGSQQRYIVCGAGTLIITTLLLGFFYAAAGNIAVQIAFWMSAGCLVSCQKLLERMAAFDEEYQ